MGKQHFNLVFDFDANMGQVKSSIEGLKKSLSGISLPTNFASNFEKLFGSLEKEMSDFEAMAKSGFTNMADVKKAESAFGRISKLISQLSLQSSKVTGLDPDKLIPKQVSDKIAAIQNQWKQLNAEQGKKDELTPKIKKQNDAIEAQKKRIEALLIKKKALEEDSSALGREKGGHTKRRNAAQQSLKAAEERRASLEAQLREQQSIKEADPKNAEAKVRISQLEEEIKKTKKEIADYASTIKSAQAQIDRLNTSISKNGSAQRKLAADYEIAQSKLEGLETDLRELAAAAAVSPEGLAKLRQDLAELSGMSLDEIPEDLEKIQELLSGFKASQVREIAAGLTEVGESAEKVGEDAKGAKSGLESMSDAAGELAAKEKEIDRLSNSIKEFFSIGNSIQLFKRAITEAFETVKELDATMTEAAVVTNFSIGDMWDKLPEYSANARELGVSINGMYQATTLYYQQGLKSAEAMALGIETMKMARIASMESADATEAMTAALRGFNMELSETSATRVNDVYSQLAAVTAADTEQIATAMSKTASIAASANMEFETTAALLAQIIETTQEAPETAGTAMKTIIARFSEVKELRSQGLTTGQDEEGEEIDVNKIQKALRTVGISMEGFFAGTEGLDSILLKLAEKWGSLDFETQRYIATMAAGSRQQSRFIAMMSDYERTTELVTSAQDSAGASQRQFNKTLDSMKTKLQKLSNAWDEFVMGLSNNEILKFGVDLLTGLLEGINALTNGISGGNGLVKSLTSLVMVWGALKGGRSLLESGLGWVGSALQGSDKRGADPIMPNSGAKGAESGQSWANSFFDKIKEVFNRRQKEINFDLESRDLGTYRTAAARDKAIAKRLGVSRAGGLAKDAVSETERVGGKDLTRSKFTYKGQETTEPMQGSQYFGKIKGQEGALVPMNDALKETSAQAESTSLSIDKTSHSVKEVGAASSESGTQVVNLQNNLAQTSQTAQKTGVSMETATRTIQGVGAVALSAGAAFGMLAANAEKAGNEELAESLSNIASWLTTFGTVALVATKTIPLIKSAVVALGAMAGPIGIIAAVVVAIVAGVILWRKEAEKLKDSYKLEQLNKQLDELIEAEDEAKSKLDDITDSKKDLIELGNAFDGLVKGSQAWNEALIANNEKVLELIDTYPILLEYLSTGLNGELIIGNEGWEKLIDSQKATISSATAAKLTTQQDINELDLKVRLKEIVIDNRRDLFGGFDSADSLTDKKFEKFGSTPETVLKIAEEMAKAGIVTEKATEEQIKGFIEKLGLGLNEAYVIELSRNIKSLGVDFDKLGLSIMQTIQLEKARADVIAGNIASQSQIVQKAKYGSVAEEISSQIYGDYQDRVNKEIEAIASDMAKNKNDEIYYAEYGTARGLTSEEVKKKVQDKELSLEEIRSSIAADRVTKQWQTSMEAYATKLDEISGSISQENFSVLVGLLSNEGLGMKLGTNLDENWLSTLGLSQDWIDLIKENYQNGLTALEHALDPNQTYGVNYKDRVEGINKVIKNALDSTISLSVEQASQLAKLYADLEIAGGDIDAFNATLMSILSGLTGSELEQALNMLLTTDYGTTNSIDLTIDALRDLGIEIDKELASKVYEETNAIKKFDMGQINKQIEDLEGLEDIVQEKLEENNKVYSKDEKDALIKAGLLSKDDFVKTGTNEFVYMGETNTLLESIKTLIIDILGEVRPGLEKQIKQGEAFDAARKSSAIGYGTISHFGANDEEFITTLTAADIYEGIMNNVAWITEDQMLKLVEDFSLLEGIDYSGFTKEQLRQAILDREADVYGGGSVLTTNKINQGDEVADAEIQALAEQIGTQAFDALVAKATLGVGGNRSSEQAGQALDAMIQTEEGLDAVIESTTNRLVEQNEAWKDCELSVKNFEYKVRQADKQVDKLNETIKDQAEGLSSLNETDVFVAASVVAKDAQKVWGEFWDAGLVTKYKDQFLLLAEGGEVAEEAWSKLSKISFDIAVEKEVQNSLPEAQKVYDAVLAQLPTAGMTFELDAASLELASANYRDYLDELAAAGIQVEVIPKKGGGFMLLGQRIDASGTNFSSYTPSGGGGGSSKTYENSYDKLHNELEQINETLRERERLERQYQRLLDRSLATVTELAEIRDQTIDNYEAEIALQQGILAGRLTQIAEEVAANPDLQKYVQVDQENQTIRIDWNALEALRDSDTGERVDEYYSMINDWLDSISSAQDAIWEAEDGIYEEMQKGKDEYLDLEQQVKDALIDQSQKEIDKMSEVNDAINDTNSRLIDSLQSAVDKSRQDRENAKTEQELSDKQRRLAYLQQDTSGANATEILALQKEIEEGQQDYTDTLIDQKINELQDQNDRAAEQRERQIQLAQDQLDKYSDSAEIWDRVAQIIAEGSGDSGLRAGSFLEALLKEAAGFGGMSSAQQQDWLDTTNKLVVGASVYVDKGPSTPEVQAPSEPESPPANPYGNPSQAGRDLYPGYEGEDIKALQYTLNTLGYNCGEVDGVFGPKTASALKKFQTTAGIDADGIVGPQTRKAFQMKGFKTGGLASFTGPAWLDGTKSRPEYILSADQTKVFFTLVDVLSGWSVGENKSSEKSGDNTYDIDINVESIGSDYDVEQLANKVKSLINEDARYRNNNAISLMR